MTLHGAAAAEALKPAERFSGAMVKAVLVKGWLANELLSPCPPAPPPLLTEVAAERTDNPQLLLSAAKRSKLS